MKALTLDKLEYKYFKIGETQGYFRPEKCPGYLQSTQNIQPLAEVFPCFVNIFVQNETELVIICKEIF